jgi:hypothetical protein
MDTELASEALPRIFDRILEAQGIGNIRRSESVFQLASVLGILRNNARITSVQATHVAMAIIDATDSANKKRPTHFEIIALATFINTCQ